MALTAAEFAKMTTEEIIELKLSFSKLTKQEKIKLLGTELAIWSKHLEESGDASKDKNPDAATPGNLTEKS